MFLVKWGRLADQHTCELVDGVRVDDSDSVDSVFVKNLCGNGGSSCWQFSLLYIYSPKR